MEPRMVNCPFLTDENTAEFAYDYAYSACSEVCAKCQECNPEKG